MTEAQIDGFSLDDLLNLEDQSGKITYPDVVQGRVLQIDGDFLAYMASFDEGITYQMMQHNTDVMIETLRLLAGAEKVNIHLTPSGSDKGKRYEHAVLKEYQGNRDGKVKPANLEKIRLYMANAYKAILHYDQEADDGLAQGNYDAIKKGCRELSVIVSKDKDLNIAPGLHLNWDTGKLFDVSGFGEITLDGSKIRGTGEKFFWCQMLMGDTADNIPGLPKVSGKDMHNIKPTKEYEKLMEVIKTSKDPDKVKVAQVKYDARPAFSCGAATTFKIMEKVATAKEAYETVKQLYKNSFEQDKYIKLKKDENEQDVELKWYDLFISNGILLWMRRIKDDKDFLRYVKELHHAEA